MSGDPRPWVTLISFSSSFGNLLSLSLIPTLLQNIHAWPRRGDMGSLTFFLPVEREKYWVGGKPRSQNRELNKTQFFVVLHLLGFVVLHGEEGFF
jgi:hypothetical protein